MLFFCWLIALIVGGSGVPLGPVPVLTVIFDTISKMSSIKVLNEISLFSIFNFPLSILTSTPSLSIVTLADLPILTSTFVISSAEMRYTLFSSFPIYPIKQLLPTLGMMATPSTASSVDFIPNCF